MKYTKTKKVGLFALIAFMVLGGQACGAPEGSRLGAPPQVVLDYWTVFNDRNDLQPIIEQYQAINPHIVINVRMLRADEYENALLNALAEDRGPDIFSVHNTSIRKYQSKLQPMPPTTTIDQAVERGTVTKDIYTEPKTEQSFSRRYISENFVEQVLNDVEVDNQIYGLPLSMDTLALFYNRSMLNTAGIAQPARNYDELQEQVLTLTRQDRLGNILQSGVAMGTADNVARHTDIVSLLMMQNGTRMTDDVGFATFDRVPETLQGRPTPPGVDALAFYTDFASPTKQVYTWNANQPNSLEAFMQGRVAYFFGYAYHIPMIRAQAPALNFGITTAPQIQGNPVTNFANYWVEGVSQKSDNVDEAWNFIQFMVRPDVVGTYLEAAQLPTAVRPLIDEQREDEDLGPFAQQVLTARSWYKGQEPEAVDDIFAEMIERALAGTAELRTIVTDGARKINQTL